MKKRINTKEGDWFAVPLRNGGYALGVVARKGRGGILFGYFFGPKHSQSPTIDIARTLRPEDAVLREQFGDLGIRNGEWPILGRLPDWNRAEWPMPEFGRVTVTKGIEFAWLVRYDDNDPSVTIEERRTSVEEARRLPADGLSGYGAVEIILTKILSD